MIGALAAMALAKPPHLIMLIMDDVGWADTSMRGGAFPTPRIDALRAESLLLDRYYTQPVCSPTRSSFMTGMYPFHTGMQHVHTLVPGTTAGVPPETPTIAEVLRESGYETHAVGKWHLGYSRFAQTPVGRGFDSFMGYLQGQTDYYNHSIPMTPEWKPELTGMDFWDNTTGELSAYWSVYGQYTMPLYKNRVRDIIAGLAPEKSLFLYYAQQEIHLPIEYPPESKHTTACSACPKDYPSEVQNRQALCAMMNDLDEEIGDLVDTLKAKGMWEETLVWVSTDNGGMTHWSEDWPASTSSNWPLRGGKSNLFEGGLRTTSWIMGGVLPATLRGTTYGGLLHAVDIFPTLVARTGAKPPNTDGKDVWEALVKGEAGEREIPLNVLDNGTDYSAIISGDFKLIVGSGTDPKFPQSDGYWTAGPEYTYYPPPENATTLHLFNLTADPLEKDNLAEAMPEMAQKLRARLLWYGKAENGYRPPQENVPNPKSLPALHNHTWAPYL